MTHRVSAIVRGLCFIATIVAPILFFSSPAHASQAWGSINNFDTVNDTGGECHGFEIELDDIHSKDITYTYDWNHYGTPKITEDNTDPLHPKVFVRYEAKRNPDGTWTAFTAVPSAPISPTQGHQFTNPSVNFGGEHFGVGFLGAPTNIKYNWLRDDGLGNLVFAGAVYISTPTFTYVPPAPNVPAQVVAAVVLPPPPVPPPTEFGPAMWVKEIKTVSHNNRKVELRDLVSDDPNDPNFKNWKNGEQDEVEVEWRILQTSQLQAGGGVNNELIGAPEGLPNGDEVITRRYEFYNYTGPIDAETGQAMADQVAADGKHGVGTASYADYFDFTIGEWHITTTDLSKLIVTGDYEGAQMAGFDAQAKIGLADHVQDGEVNAKYVDRSLVIGGTAPILNTMTGALPNGMNFDTVTGVLSGMPTEAGLFTFTVHSMDAVGGDVTMTYHLTVAPAGQQAPPHSVITLTASPALDGVLDGANDYPNGTVVTVTATANPGFVFVNWTEQGAIVSITPSYQFTVDQNRALVANFVPSGPVNITTSVLPLLSGTTTGDGVYNPGDSVTVSASPNAGYGFVNWTASGVVVSSTPSYTFNASVPLALVANFTKLHPTTLSMAAVNGQVGKKVTLTAVLKDSTTKTVLIGKSVQFQLDGVDIGAPVTTNTYGKAQYSFIVPEEFLLGIHTTRASYVGEGIYKSSTVASTLGVAKGGVRLTIPNVSGKAGATVKLTAKILNLSSQPMVDETIYFTVAGVAIGSAISNASGVATIYYTIPVGTVAGYYATTATFLEDDDHFGFTKSGWLIVK